MEYILDGDKHKMNWFRDDYEYAEVLCSAELSFQVCTKREGDIVQTSVLFRNEGSKPVFTSQGSIGIRFPLQDRYESSGICMVSRCHTHIFCGYQVRYIMALRMGGDAPHMGMCLTAGSLLLCVSL